MAHALPAMPTLRGFVIALAGRYAGEKGDGMAFTPSDTFVQRNLTHAMEGCFVLYHADEFDAFKTHVSEAATKGLQAFENEDNFTVSRNARASLICLC